MVESPSDRVPKKALDGISREQKLATAEIGFWLALYWFPDFREFIEVELGQTEPRGPHEPPGCALVPRGPLLHLLVPS